MYGICSKGTHSQPLLWKSFMILGGHEVNMAHTSFRLLSQIRQDGENIGNREVLSPTDFLKFFQIGRLQQQTNCIAMI